MKCKMCGLVHRTEGKQAKVVGLVHFFERPANAHVTRQSPAASGGPFKGSDGDGHRKGPAGWTVHRKAVA
jgi:hypothetical protein